MRFLKGLIVFLLVLVVALVGVAIVLPGSAHVERSVTIERPASEVFAVLDSYRRFNDWSPWAAKDPNAHYTISGAASGVGARLSWVHWLPGRYSSLRPSGTRPTMPSSRVVMRSLMP